MEISVLDFRPLLIPFGRSVWFLSVAKRSNACALSCPFRKWRLREQQERQVSVFPVGGPARARAPAPPAQTYSSTTPNETRRMSIEPDATAVLRPFIKLEEDDRRRDPNTTRTTLVASEVWTNSRARRGLDREEGVSAV
jgi:hypothetical protein